MALFVQGCHFHCYNCFNSETWEFDGGKEWTEDIKDKFIQFANRPYITRISILGGEPLADENLSGINNLINQIKLLIPPKTIWLYTGYTWESIFGNSDSNFSLRKNIIQKCDVLVDGPYVDSLRDITLAFRGSSNQRLIDVQETLKSGEVVLWSD